MNNIKRPHFGGKVAPQALLSNLADADELKSVIVICEWDDGTVTTPWSYSTFSQMTFGAKVLDMNITEAIESGSDD